MSHINNESPQICRYWILQTDICGTRGHDISWFGLKCFVPGDGIWFRIDWQLQINSQISLKILVLHQCWTFDLWDFQKKPTKYYMEINRDIYVFVNTTNTNVNANDQLVKFTFVVVRSDQTLPPQTDRFKNLVQWNSLVCGDFFFFFFEWNIHLRLIYLTS